MGNGTDGNGQRSLSPANKHPTRPCSHFTPADSLNPPQTLLLSLFHEREYKDTERLSNSPNVTQHFLARSSGQVLCLRLGLGSHRLLIPDEAKLCHALVHFLHKHSGHRKFSPEHTQPAPQLPARNYVRTDKATMLRYLYKAESPARGSPSP